MRIWLPFAFILLLAGASQAAPATSSASAQIPAGITDEQRQAWDALPPEQRKKLEAQFLKSGGRQTSMQNEQARSVAEGQSYAAYSSMSPTVLKAISDSLKIRPEVEQEILNFEQRTSKGQLKRFGFDLFQSSKRRLLSLEDALSKGQIPPQQTKDALSGFLGPLDLLAAAVNTAAPPLYVLNPGDQITVYYWGDLLELTTVKIKVDESGEIGLPQVGRFVVRGMSLAQLQKAMQEQMQRVLSKNIKIVATLDKLQSMQISITGEAYRPGSYAVSSVTTLFNALYACGGPNENGSLRNIKLLRNNKTVSVDFYDYLMKGDDRADLPLQAGDTVFIGGVGKLASISGEVVRPSLYELKQQETLKDLVAMARGIKPSGLASKVLILSVIPNRERVAVDVDLSSNLPSSDRALQDGDSVMVEAIAPAVTNVVTLVGAVKVQGVYELKKNMRVADLFRSGNEPIGEAHLGRVDVIRLDRDGRTTTAIPVDLNKALQNDEQHNIALAPLDRIVVYSKWDIKYYPARIVSIEGSVTRPGNYPRTEGMRVRDLLLLAGGMVPGSVMEVKVAKARYHSELKPIPVQVDRLEQGDESQNLLLDDEDVVLVRSDSDFMSRPQWVTISGEVKYPGSYPLLRKDYRLSELIQQAGGLTRMANQKGTVFLRKRENLPSAVQNTDVLTANAVVNVLNKLDFERQAAKNMLLLKKDLATAGAPDAPPAALGTGGVPYIYSGTTAKESMALAMAPTIASQAGQATGLFLNAYSQGGGITSEARSLTEKQLSPSVRVVINMDKIVSGGSDNPDNIILMNGDSISVPDKQETVSVIGAVMGPVTTKPGSQRTVSELVNLAGGYAKDADKDGVLVFRVNGTLMKAESAGKVEDGDIIYVPTKVMTTEVITTEDKVIGAIKFALITIASVAVFLALIP